MLNIEVKKKGFPIKIGEVEVWFDMSIEQQERLPQVQRDFHIQMEHIQKEAQEIAENSTMTDEELSTRSLEAYRKALEIAYDEIFGIGTFNKLYSTYPSVESLTDVYVAISENIVTQIEKYNKERIKELEKTKAKYLKKKKK